MNINAIATVASKALTGATLLAASVALMAGNGQASVDRPWGESQGPAFSEQQIAQWVDEMVTEQVADLGCSTTPALTERVAVRNAHGFDTGVVRVVTFDEGWALGTAGKVIVVGWCK